MQAEGKGLGQRFLRHIERTRLLIHLVDLDPANGRDPVEDYRTIHDELEAYSKELSRRPQIVAANKAELPGTEERRRALEQFCAAAGLPFHAVSAITGLGLSALVRDAGDRLLSGLSATASRDVIECRASGVPVRVTEARAGPAERAHPGAVRTRIRPPFSGRLPGV